MNFIKMHGLGNDFVMVNLMQEELPGDLAALARKVCHRHYGIGADGMILILPSEQADVKMRIINSDGSEAEMCGNGIRCLAKLVYEYKLVQTPFITVETLAGIMGTEVILDAGDQVQGIKVDMGEPRLLPESVPVLLPGKQAVAQGLNVDGNRVEVTAVSMGNPHCVIFVPDAAAAPVTTLGPILEKHPAFPAKTNVEFVEIINPGEVKMRIWERGAQETMACGTGACAVIVAGVINNKTQREAVVHLKGGDLKIHWADNNHVFMTGPAVVVFEGRYFL